MASEADQQTASQFVARNPDSLWTPGLGAIHIEFQAASFAQAGELVLQLTQAADHADHHPEISIRYPGIVRVSLTTHAAGGLTVLDESLAIEFSALAEQAGCEQRRAPLAIVEIAIDTTDADRIRPFWAAVTGYGDDHYGNLVDPTGLGPSIWFQAMDPPRLDRNRIHLDITVSPDDAEERVAKAVAAGGRLVSDRRAPAFWVLADADGNEICICTWQDRD